MKVCRVIRSFMDKHKHEILKERKLRPNGKYFRPLMKIRYAENVIKKTTCLKFLINFLKKMLEVETPQATK